MSPLLISAMNLKRIERARRERNKALLFTLKLIIATLITIYLFNR